MKPFPVFLALLLALPLAARADTRPDFDADAKPILRQQPQLLDYVRHNFDVKDAGYSRTPGTDNHAPPPPYIFRARPRGSEGPYNITLFIQPGPPGHILFVKGDTGHGSYAASGSSPSPNPAYTGAPSTASQSPTGNPTEMPTPATQPSANAMETQPASASNSSAVTAPPSPEFSGVTADTPSGPIKSTSSSTQGSNLAPPSDPAPTPAQ